MQGRALEAEGVRRRGRSTADERRRSDGLGQPGPRLRQQDRRDLPVKEHSDNRLGSIFLFSFFVVFALIIAGAIDAASAQGNPFGVGPRGAPSAPPPTTGFMGWIFAKQAEFYRMLSGSLRAVKADSTAVAGLFGISFLYGVF